MTHATLNAQLIPEEGFIGTRGVGAVTDWGRQSLRLIKPYHKAPHRITLIFYLYQKTIIYEGYSKVAYLFYISFARF